MYVLYLCSNCFTVFGDEIQQTGENYWLSGVPASDGKY